MAALVVACELTVYFADTYLEESLVDTQQPQSYVQNFIAFPVRA